MTAAPLRLVYSASSTDTAIPFAEQSADHAAILEGYFNTYITRGYTDETLGTVRSRLIHWFDTFPVPDAAHPTGLRPLFVWEAMEPVVGRERIIDYAKCLVAAELARSTIRQCLTSLRRLFGYVLAWPYLPQTCG